MTFDEIVDEIIDIRFREGQRTSVKHWVNLRSQLIWAVADWPFKRVGPVELTLTAGDASPSLPSDFHRPVRLYDDAGLDVVAFTPQEYDDIFTAGTLSSISGQPDSYKWVDDVITLYPTPDAAATYQLIYERRHSYLDGGTTPTVGSMASDDDEPLWDEEFHYILVHGALATGLRLENDPTFPAIEEEFQSALQLMREHYLPATHVPLQYGKESW